MDLPPAWSEVCLCGRTFSLPRAHTYHKRSCQTTKKRLNGGLERAKEVWKAKKRRKLEEGPEKPEEVLASPPHIPDSQLTPDEPPASAPILESHVEVNSISTGIDDLNQAIADRRVRQEHRLPKRFRDVLPEPPAALPPPTLSQPQPESDQPTPTTSSPESHEALPVLPQVSVPLKSTPNAFGLFRQYRATRFPEHDPDDNLTCNDLMDVSVDSSSTNPGYSYHPYPNQSSFLLGEWYWNDGAKKSQSSFSNLLKIVRHPDFRPEDVARTKWKRINSQLGGDLQDDISCEGGWEDECASGCWIETPIKIQVPFPKTSEHPGQQEFQAGKLRHRKLVSVIREKISRPSSHPHHHLEPYELYWQPSQTSKPARVHGELYSSDAFIEAHRDLQSSPGEPGCELPRAIVAIMFASDGTELTTFSNAKLWPVYLAIGNESKDRRSKPSYQAFEHIAYFEQLPDTFKAFASERIGRRGPDDKLIAHCHREIYDGQWAIMLDDDFLEAYTHGIVIDGCDGIRRRYYPRIVTYSADYREKILLASTRFIGLSPCPRCLIPLAHMHRMGMCRDMAQRKTLSRVDDARHRSRIAAARKSIYEGNNTISSAGVERLLKKDSLVPTTVFVFIFCKLGQFGFCLFLMLVVDLMHELELGVWKSLFIHLLRILNCRDKSLVHKLDQRFREVPPFGRDGIRKIRSNRSELKKMTAHDYEDLLLCAIPVFEGLLPEPHNTRLLKLLFDFAHFHGLAKLRMHIDPMLDIMSEVTTSLGGSFREFKEKTCNAFLTQELQREKEARERRNQKKKKDNSGPEPSVAKHPKKEREPKQLKLNTYKFHALGDYVPTIRCYGTTDSYTTQTSELEHRTSKARYTRTTGRSIPQELSKIERRERCIRRIREKMHRSSPQADAEEIVNDPRMQYNMGKTQNSPVHVPTFLQRNDGDPAVKNFFPKLREHLLPRIQEVHREEAASQTHPTLGATPVPVLEDDLSRYVFLKKDRIYHHKVCRFHFTTYDVRRGMDVINPGTSRCNVMLLADDADEALDHHFLYARVLAAYHANVIYMGPGMHDYEARRLDFLWVRWYELVDPASSGWRTSKLDSLRFPPINGHNAFSFLDPKDVLHGCHIIPRFAKEKRHANGVGNSRCAKNSKDYNFYYVGRFSERDLLMRYHWGLGVGHLHAHQHASTSTRASEDNIQSVRWSQQEAGEMSDDDANTRSQDVNGNAYDFGDAEFSLEDPESEGWEDIESEDEEGSGNENMTSEEEDFTGM